MGTKIEWADETWNPVIGCKVKSAGCTNCYAMKLAGTRMKNHPTRKGLTDIVNGKPVWNGQVYFIEKAIEQPLHWKKPRRIFVVAHGDLFYEAVPDDWINRVFEIMDLCHWHKFMVLTKRPDRMRTYIEERYDGEPAPEQIIVGASIEDQKSAEERLWSLAFTSARQRFISYEPALGPVDLTQIRAAKDLVIDVLHKGDCIHQVIVGGESKDGARPMDLAWARSVRDQCKAAGVPFFMKQLSQADVGKDYGAFEKFPADLQIREMPA